MVDPSQSPKQDPGLSLDQETMFEKPDDRRDGGAEKN